MRRARDVSARAVAAAAAAMQREPVGLTVKAILRLRLTIARKRLRLGAIAGDERRQSLDFGRLIGAGGGGRRARRKARMLAGRKRRALAPIGLSRRIRLWIAPPSAVSGRPAIG